MSDSFLFSSLKGEVACVEHVPDAASSRWHAEGWRAIAPEDARYVRYQCQHCERTPIRPLQDVARFDDAVTHLRDLVAAGHSPLRVVAHYIARILVPSLVADDAGCYIAVNEAACALTGFSHQELLRLCVADLTPPEGIPIGERLWNAFVRADYQHGDYALRCKDGSIVLVHYDAYTNIGPGVHISFLTTGDRRLK
jgi:PAS domain-containing protein